MGMDLKVAMEAARRHLVESGKLTEERARNKSPQGICNILGLRYPDGSAPHGKAAKQKAVISWFATRRTVVIKSQAEENRTVWTKKQALKTGKAKHYQDKADRRLIDSATALAAKHQRNVNPAAHDKANNDKFLNSFEWRRVRMEALKKYGPVCQCCGASPATGAVMNVDHIKPRKLFPHLALDVDNLQVLCGPCNHGKSNFDMTDWRQKEDQCYDPPELIRLVRDIGYQS